MMDIEKLIAYLLVACAGNRNNIMGAAATALSTLQAENEKLKRALAEMWFAYVNKDGEIPHTYEEEAVELAQEILGPWGECVPKYLRRGSKVERYTEKVDGIWSVSCKYEEPPYPVVTQEVIDRLAAYEDTGLEPEEIQKLKAEAEKPKRTVSDLIRNMRGDELLELIEEIRIHCCPPLCDQNHYCDEDCHKGIAAWLNGPADERILAYLKRPKMKEGASEDTSP